MSQLTLHTQQLDVETDVGVDIRDITDRLNRIVADSGIVDGQLSAAVVGSTGSLTTIEYEPGVVADLRRAINELAPPDREYQHELAWHDGNGHSHVGAALLGPTISLPVRKGSLHLGTWQQVVLINHDNRGRKRPVDVTVIGRA